jgi:aarF domain-containing kinase
MAQALCNMGATEEDVDVDRLARDIQRVMRRVSTVQSDITVTDLGEDEVTNFLLELVDVTEDNGLKLPREFGLLVKQSLYFDRYLKILAPDLDVMNDNRVNGLGPANGEAVVQINDSCEEDTTIDV